MSVAINAMLLFGMVLVSMLFYRYVSRISQWVAQIQEDVEELQGSDVAESCSFAQKSAFRLAVEIVDPVALAKRESQLASTAAELAPNFVAQEVYKRIQKEIALGLEKQGIDAKVTIFMA